MLRSKKYSAVKIANRNNDIGKPWFVYYSYWHPVKLKMERVRVYEDLATYTSIKERTKAAKLLKVAVEQLLSEGFNPFEEFAPNDGSAQIQNCKQALEHVLKVKKKQLKPNSFPPYKSRLYAFLEYLEKQELQLAPVTAIKKNHIVEFIDLQKSNRSRNNALTDLHGTFEKMIDLELLAVNPAARIKKIKQDSRKNKPFTPEQIADIKDLLLSTDPQLFLFIKIVAYCWLRPQEVVKLQVKHINLKRQVLRIDTKGQVDKTKIIVKLLQPDFEAMELHQLPQGYYLFTPEGKPGIWQTTDTNKRNYFSSIFKRKVKDVLKYGPEYGIYSFRHSFSLNLYQNFTAVGMNEQEAKLKMLPITGHQSIKALENYLRDIGAILPEDYGHHLDIGY